MDETHADIENVLRQMSRIFVDLTVEKDKNIKRSEDMAILESELYFKRDCLIKKEEELVRLNKLLADGEATCTFLLKTNSELEEELEELKANFDTEKEKSAKQEQDLVELQDLVKLQDLVELQDLGECTRYFVNVNAENEMTIETLKSDLDRVETDLKDEKEKMLCQICMDRPRNALCMPCKHLGYCITCLQEHMRQSQTCPTCRSPNQEILECYI